MNTANKSCDHMVIKHMYKCDVTILTSVYMVFVGAHIEMYSPKFWETASCTEFYPINGFKN